LSDQELHTAWAESERIGVIGGTFDPIHYAHLAIAEEVYHEIKLARVVFVPAGQPPHKAGLPVTAAEHRLKMLRLAIAGNPHFALSLVDMQRSGPSYTVETLRLLRQEWGPRAGLYFVIGGDSLKDLPTWYDPAGILAEATIVALMRPGYMDVRGLRRQLEARLPGLDRRLITLEGPLMEISSTDLRRRVIEGRPIKYQTPEAVERYIFEQRLYRDNTATYDLEKSAGRTQESAHATNAI
jgi:nicotinate-nucleotide adenylyltransferase